MNRQHSLTRFSRMLMLGFSSALLLTACDKDDNGGNNNDNPELAFVGLTAGGKLNWYNSRMPGIVESTVSIGGLQPGETVLSIDYRPATGQLYALGSSSRIYTVNQKTGAATAIGSGAFTPALASQNASIDFNPTVDRIRLVTGTGQNLRLHPELGTVAATDGSINGGTNPSVRSIAYTNSEAGAASTTLFDIDPATRILYRQDPPNDGSLVQVATIDVNFTSVSGFDIDDDDDEALAAFTTDNVTTLYELDLTNGATVLLGVMSEPLIDLAVMTEPVAYAVDESNNLHIFDPSDDDNSITKAITGLQAGENILGIDFRPLNGQLWALGSSSRLYTINLSSGAAAPVGTAGAFTLAGDNFGFDFNPTVDRIRVVSNTGQNLRLNPLTGGLAATDGTLNPGTPSVSGAAYTENVPGATSTMLYVVDSGNLYTQAPPNNGTLVPVGSLGLTIGSNNGFDIGGTTGNAWLVATVGSATRLYMVNLANGATTPGRTLPGNMRGFALGLGF